MINRLEFEGYYYDGITADKNSVVVRLTSYGLQINEQIIWDYEEIRVVDEQYSDVSTELENLNSPHERLVVMEQNFERFIEKLFPGKVKSDFPTLKAFITAAGVLTVLLFFMLS